MKITSKPILLVEDDQVDVMTVKRALKEIHVINQVVKHGRPVQAHPGGSADHVRGTTGQSKQLRSGGGRLYGQAGGLPAVR